MIDTQDLSEARMRRDTLRRQRGAARLDDAPFDDALLDAAEREVAALSAALQEQERREAEARHLARSAAVARCAEDLEQLEARRLASVGEAETAARALVGALDDVADTGERMRSRLRETDLPVPLALAEGAMTDRMSQRLAAVLGGLTGHPTRYAQVGWRPSWRPAGEDWHTAEQRELAADLGAIVEMATHAPGP